MTHCLGFCYLSRTHDVMNWNKIKQMRLRPGLRKPKFFVKKIMKKLSSPWENRNYSITASSDTLEQFLDKFQTWLGNARDLLLLACAKSFFFSSRLKWPQWTLNLSLPYSQTQRESSFLIKLWKLLASAKSGSLAYRWVAFFRQIFFLRILRHLCKVHRRQGLHHLAETQQKSH